MVAKRIITTLMLNNGILFRSKKFIPDYRYTLNFIDMWSVDELVILDITRNVNLDDNPSMTRHFGGEHAFRPRKRETGQFFELQQDYGNVFGNQFN